MAGRRRDKEGTIYKKAFSGAELLDWVLEQDAVEGQLHKALSLCDQLVHAKYIKRLKATKPGGGTSPNSSAQQLPLLDNLQLMATSPPKTPPISPAQQPTQRGQQPQPQPPQIQQPQQQKETHDYNENAFFSFAQSRKKLQRSGK